MQDNEPAIIYEDSERLVINKPFGLLVHPTKHTNEPTLVDWLLKTYPEIKTVGEDSARPGIIHRLDRDTGGLMVIAKTQQSFEHLKDLFTAREIHKKYLALVWGIIKNDTGIINKPIGMLRGAPKRTTHSTGKTREAITEYIIRTRYPKTNMTLVELSPKTGRTHQLRVHMASISHNIVGDKLYGRKKAQLPFELHHQFLFAYSLDIPTKQGPLHFEIGLPEDLKIILHDLT
ncbi:MAG: RluA family pseudouridine synthase [Parcubacteria group bacterium]|nr:RluA family pseudouridine synthase [Parcubacteria group bacterium]